MGNVFGSEKPLKEVLRENKRMIKRAIRELDREKLHLEREETRLVVEIKKNAKAGQMKSVKIMAKVRNISSFHLFFDNDCLILTRSGSVRRSQTLTKYFLQNDGAFLDRI